MLPWRHLHTHENGEGRWPADEQEKQLARVCGPAQCILEKRASGSPRKNEESRQPCNIYSRITAEYGACLETRAYNEIIIQQVSQRNRI
jgi:hypothetical protein